jgi:hypothetical protein
MIRTEAFCFRWRQNGKQSLETVRHAAVSGARTLALFLTIYAEQSSENVAQQEQVERVHYD